MKNLLIITQKVDLNDDILGFFHEWIREFSKRWSKITVICLKLGSYDLPNNVRVLSLGKEKNLGKVKYLINFYKYIWQLRKEYGVIFVHMNPQYIVLGWPFWSMWGKTMSLWYAHGYVPLMLRIADKLTNISFASTPEGYRLKSKKLKIVGQGIDVNKFQPVAKPDNGVFKIVSIGRISPSKDYATLIMAIAELKVSQPIEVEILGSPATSDDHAYLKEMKDLISKNNLEQNIGFVGPVANRNIIPVLQSADLFVNMGHTGSLDKANLEAMSCGLPILTCNEAYENILGSYREKLMYPKRDYQKLAEKIIYMMNLKKDERVKIGQDLRQIIVRDHNLEDLVYKITNILNNYAV